MRVEGEGARLSFVSPSRNQVFNSKILFFFSFHQKQITKITAEAKILCWFILSKAWNIRTESSTYKCNVTKPELFYIAIAELVDQETAFGLELLPKTSATRF